MALSRFNSEYTYRSSPSPGSHYFFTVAVDSGNRVSVRDIQSPLGRISDGVTPLPQTVTDDIQTAILQVRNFLAQSSATNGQVSFSDSSSAAVSFTTPMAGTSYRVVLDVPDFVSARVTSKTTTGFVVELGVSWTGTVGYDVFV